MLAKKANLNRCGFRCKAEVRHFCVVTEWRQMAITVCKQGPFLCWVSPPLIPTYHLSFKVRVCILRKTKMYTCTEKMLLCCWYPSRHQSYRAARDGERMPLAGQIQYECILTETQMCEWVTVLTRWIGRLMVAAAEMLRRSPPLHIITEWTWLNSNVYLT